METMDEQSGVDLPPTAIHEMLGLAREIDLSSRVLSLSVVLQILLTLKTVRREGLVNIQRKDGLCEKALFVKGNIRIQFCKNERNEYELIVVNLDKKKMTVLTANSMESELKELDMSGMEENGVIDLTNTGCYWEGGVLNGRERCCCGYGKEFNEENNVVFEGFMYKQQKVCYGKEYRGIRENTNGMNGLVYEGGYVNGDRYGEGWVYNLKGAVEYSGRWIENRVAVKKVTLKDGDDLIVPMSIEEVVIRGDSFNDERITSLQFSPLLSRLRRIKMGDKCFRYVSEFTVSGLKRLKRLAIGSKCFKAPNPDSDEDEVDDYESGSREYVCRITHCPRLKELLIRGESFETYNRFELSHVNSLQFLSVAWSCFYWLQEVILKGTLFSSAKEKD